MIIKIRPDKQKAVALQKMAQITLERLSDTQIEKYPSNSVNDYYDIIHKLMKLFRCLKDIKLKVKVHIKNLLISYVKSKRLMIQ